MSDGTASDPTPPQQPEQPTTTAVAGALTLTLPGSVQVDSAHLSSANLVGPAGPTGPEGQRGPAGPEGQRGPVGPVGPVVPGAIMAYAGASAPSGWLLCNGAEVNRTTYAALFGVIGETCGVGNGNTTFNLPDLRGRYPLGPDNMGGTSADRVTAAEADTRGGSGGAETHTLTNAEMPGHSHGYRTRLYNHDRNIANLQNTWDDIDPDPTDHPYWQSLHTTNVSDQSEKMAVIKANGATSVIMNAGGGEAHSNMSPYLTLNYIIKT